MTARDAWGDVAHQLRILADKIDEAIEPGAARAPVAPSAPVAPAGVPPAPVGASYSARTIDPARPPEPVARYEPQGAFTRCPAHDREWKPSKFPDGPGYCTAQSEDPEWSKNGYCAITERSAPVWMRKHAA